MFGKYFVSFLLVALVAVQATPRYNVEVNDLDVETFISIGELWEKIKDLLKKAKEAINDITGDMKDALKKIKDKINEIIGESSVNEIVDKIIAYIKKTVGTVNDKVKQCIEAKRPQITQIAKDAKAGLSACASTAQTNMDAVQQQAKEVKDKASQLIKDSASSGFKCLSASGALDCLSGVYDNLTTQGKVIWGQAKEALSAAKNILKEAGTCSNQVRRETTTKVKAVYEEVVECMKAYDNLIVY